MSLPRLAPPFFFFFLSLFRSPLFLFLSFFFFPFFFFREHLTVHNTTSFPKRSGNGERKVGGGGWTKSCGSSRGMKREGEAKGGGGAVVVGAGRVGRSEVPFCFSGGVWRRDSSGTLSERDVITTPLLPPSQGVPRTPFHPLEPSPPSPYCTPDQPRVQRWIKAGGVA